MPPLDPPRAFISHASEDKERFVIRFATSLRDRGVDAWVDQWEIRAGDSLTEKIFDEGIGRADAFIVVLSKVSVTKPWVRDELDSAMVQRINSGRAKRLIPIVLDKDVSVPVALQHLLWESVPERGVEGVADRVVDSIFGHTRKPPLGTSPSYANVTPRWADDPADEAVFRLIAEEVRNYGPNAMIFSNDVQARAAGLGISAERFHESMHALVNRRLINAQVMAGGLRWMLRPFPDHVWLELEEAEGVDVEGLQRQLLSAVVNEGRTDFDPRELHVSGFTLGALLRRLEASGLLSVHSLADGRFVVGSVSPLARRALRELD